MKLHATPFLAEPYCTDLEHAAAAVLPVPYEGGVSYGAGAGLGPQAILDASAQVEAYDTVLDAEPYRVGIATVESPVLPPDPEGMDAVVNKCCWQLLERVEFVMMLGGDHSISPAFHRALVAKHGPVSVVQFDAHADLRDEYDGSRLSHACAMARMRESTPHTLQLGIRSMCAEEAELIRTEGLNVCTMRELRARPARITAHIEQLPDPVFITFDVDVFDWSVVSSTGTPEPGGMLWDEALELLGMIFRERRVVGCDVVELAPREGDINSCFAVARLVYHMIGLRFFKP
jgi:agmatinase